MVTKKAKSSTKTKIDKKNVRKKPMHSTTVTTGRKTVHATEPYHPAFGIVLLVVSIIMGAVLLIGGIKTIVSTIYGDARLFSEQYTKVPTDNVFKTKSLKDALNIINEGTGIVFFGFPECPWCQAYAPMLNDLAKEHGISEIYYTNIRAEREKSTDDYEALVNVLDDYLQEDDEGAKRIYVPDTVFVIDGVIIGNDYETSKETFGYDTPEEYWTEARVANWKKNIGALMSRMNPAE